MSARSSRAASRPDSGKPLGCVHGTPILVAARVGCRQCRASQDALAEAYRRQIFFGDVVETTGRRGHVTLLGTRQRRQTRTVEDA